MGSNSLSYPSKTWENSAERFPMDRVVGWELSFTEDLS
ncbi:hypothetical protein LEP1GSC021_4004 [Leptospira noguchii str. 1993005606]|uniref:Uncharacterized protein n=1 Tax=Leptospira noguchii str. 2001034031 TaxID=1193053 RepID=M6YB21_9LEPT|nr:hypothetical protein LEP1GSC024_4996 [Leptospira noguchii str. 2001034031]EPE83910.1 hypothetical protein LEP1GSC021_4004 [Leptospira noguchii str. 1993005606]